MKYPIGIQTFEQIIEDGYVYVDKTELAVWEESALINAQELLSGEKRAFQRIGDREAGEGVEEVSDISYRFQRRQF